MEQDIHLRTPEEIRAYIKEDTAKQDAVWQDKYDHIVRAKNAILLLLLIVVFLQVHLINVMIEATSLEARTLSNTSNVALVACKPSVARL